jgi:lipopolysaccharide/colanic/teichoic acid biosynthesis glycosyltransferase
MPSESNVLQNDRLTRWDHAHTPGGAAPAERAPPFRTAGSRPEAARPGHAWYDAVKRVLDLLLTLIILVPAVPVMLMAGLLVKLTSPGPVLYTQVRVGRNGRPYTIYKIRTMIHNCESDSGPRWATALDARITPVGRVLRRTHVDELPQLWNVLRGQMSLVGPRPERPEFVPQLSAAIPGYGDRLRVRPGMTGLAQVQLPPDTDLASVCRKLAYDRFYVRHHGFRLDLSILVSTAYYLLAVHYAQVPRFFRVPSGDAVEGPGQAPLDPEPARPLEKDDAERETVIIPNTCVVPRAQRV